MKINFDYKIFIGVLSLFVITSIGYAQEANPYNPEPLMKELKAKKGKKPTKMHFLVFGDSKGSKYFPDVLKRDE